MKHFWKCGLCCVTDITSGVEQPVYAQLALINTIVIMS